MTGCIAGVYEQIMCTVAKISEYQTKFNDNFAKVTLIMLKLLSSILNLTRIPIKQELRQMVEFFWFGSHLSYWRHGILANFVVSDFRRNRIKLREISDTETDFNKNWIQC